MKQKKKKKKWSDTAKVQIQEILFLFHDKLFLIFKPVNLYMLNM